MKAIVKVTTGLALVATVLAQPALAAAPRAMDARTTTASTSDAVALRQTPLVGKKNRSTAGSVAIGAAALAAVGLGVAAAVSSDNDDDSPASP